MYETQVSTSSASLETKQVINKIAVNIIHIHFNKGKMVYGYSLPGGIDCDSGNIDSTLWSLQNIPSPRAGHRANTLATTDLNISLDNNIILPYFLERGPMGGVPYIGLRLGGGPIFAISLSYPIVKECPGNIHYHKLLTSVGVLLSFQESG